MSSLPIHPETEGRVPGTGMEPWHYATAEDLDRTMIERLRRFPREPDLLVEGARVAASLTIRAALRAYHRLSIVGRENLPTDRAFVLVANHASHLDTACILSALPLRKLHHVFPVAAQDYFFGNALRLMAAVVVSNALPFDRNGHIRASLRLCRELLAHPGNIMVIFPEGTRSLTGRIGDFKPGVGLLLAGTDVPVVPCYLSGAFEAWPKGQALPRPRPVRLVVGTPRTYARLRPGKASAIEVCTELRRTVQELALETDLPLRVKGLRYA